MKFDDHSNRELRKPLIDSLMEKDISNQLVLHAMRNIPRYFFLYPVLDRIAHGNRVFPIGDGRTIFHPYNVAYHRELLNITPGERILEIGMGSTYQVSVSAEMVAEVFTIELQQKLCEKLQKTYNGIANGIPFTEKGLRAYLILLLLIKKIVTSAESFIPLALLEQQMPGGMLVIPVDKGYTQRMKQIIKKLMAI